jgi:uncharacterized protein YkwD
MQTFSEFFAKKLEENQAPAQQPPKPGAPVPAQQPPKPGAPVPAQQPPKPGAPVPAQQPPKPGAPAAAPSPPMNPAKKQQMLKDLSVAATNAANGVLAKHGIK